jgi:citrate lyase subunit beta/citryl-CoA lyase
VQVNHPRSVALAGDQAALSEAGQALRGVLLPQAERPEQFQLLDDLLPPGAIAIPLIESPRGLLAAHEIACAPRVARLGFVPARLVAGTGIQDQHYGLLVARSLLVLTGWADTLAGPIDGASMAANDLARVTMDAEASRRIGFTGKFCTSARQVAPVAFGFCSAGG